MWHKSAKPFLESDKLVVLGIAQEQHKERTKLYKQWKQYDFPIVQDATTQLNLNAVPIPMLIDEYGVVRATRPRPNSLAKFMEQQFAPAEETTTVSDVSEIDRALEKGNKLLHQKDRDIDGAITAFESAVKLDSKNGKALFSLGVAHRMRFDSENRETGDFKTAAKLWGQALAVNPNQYIWRRRIEQYGPQLTKPYPFYDWVEKAQQSIRERGEDPLELSVSLTGTEIAKNGSWDAADNKPENPDPDKKILLDEKNYLSISSTTVPEATRQKNPVRIHLDLAMNGAFWNDEADAVKIWIDESSTGTPERRLVEVAKPTKSTNDKSSETRTVDFEFKTDKSQSECKVNGFALFHCCDSDGVCFYFRKDFTIPISAK